jgi:uncharacterized protein (DUF885 family)
MKKIILLVGLTAAIAFTACHNSSQSSSSHEAQLDSMFKNYQDERLRLYPLDATQMGIDKYDSILPNNITQSYKDTLRTFYTKWLTAAQKLDTSGLSYDQKLYYEVFLEEMNRNLDGLKFQSELMPFNQFWALPLTFGQLGSGASNQPFKTALDYRNFMKRMEGFSRWADTAIADMRKGMAQGVTLPRILAQRMVPQMSDLMQADTGKNIFYAPLKTQPKGINNDDWAKLKQEYTDHLNRYVFPSYAKLYTFIKNEYLPKTRTTSGIGGISFGKEYYTYETKYWTTTNVSPDEIFQLGLKEVARIHHEMDSVKNAAGFKGDLNAFFKYVKSSPQFYPFKTPQQVIDSFKHIHAVIEQNVDNLFSLKPKLPFEIRQTEAFRAASASAEYNEGTPDGSRPGIFYVPILDPTKYSTLDMQSLFLHEAIPGHHYQISLAMENKEIPEFLRDLYFGAYVEGWALYCEGLGKPLGLYKNPYAYFGRLNEEIHRAIRLVVDVGIHEKGWSREQAIKYNMENEAADSGDVVPEIERYMAIPGQALSYKMGELKILQMRALAMRELGSKFDIREFHKQVLNTGPLPLDIFEKKMRDWIKATKEGRKF